MDPSSNNFRNKIFVFLRNEALPALTGDYRVSLGAEEPGVNARLANSATLPLKSIHIKEDFLPLLGELTSLDFYISYMYLPSVFVAIAGGNHWLLCIGRVAVLQNARPPSVKRN